MMISELRQCFPDAEVQRDMLLDELDILQNSLKEWKDEVEKEKPTSLEGDQVTSAHGPSPDAHAGDESVSPNLSARSDSMIVQVPVPAPTTIPVESPMAPFVQPQGSLPRDHPLTKFRRTVTGPVTASVPATVPVEDPTTVPAEDPTTVSVEDPTTVSGEEPATVSVEDPTTVPVETPEMVLDPAL